MRRIALLLLLLLVPAGAQAAPLLHVTEGGVEKVDDPFLPPRAEVAAPVARGSQPVARGARAKSVPGSLDDALAAGGITQEQHDEWDDAWKEARKVKGRLPKGTRKNELGSVVGSVQTLARGGLLSATRMPAVFLELERNTAFWRDKPIPGAGARLAFGKSAVIFQYYPGQGMRIQPLANFGKANLFYNACKGINVRPGTPCRKQSLQALLDELVALGAQRGGFTAWEYLFTFDGGRPPFISSLSQGTAIQALAHGTELLGDPKYAQIGQTALGAFQKRPPVGVAVPADGGTHYVIYSFAPRYFVLNAFIQSLNGLFDFGKLTGDPVAQQLFASGEAAARTEVPRYDTGAWSIYGKGSGIGDVGRESTLSYHRVLRDFLANLCERTGTALYCQTATRFTKYLYEKPKLTWLGKKGSAIRVRLSKMSTLTVVAKARGKVVFSSQRFVGYGVKTIGLPGRATSVTIRAKDVRNHPTQITKAV